MSDSAAANSNIPTGQPPDKDAPLFADIRLLGRLLGDVIRDQEGDEIFAIVERIRGLSVRFHRDDDNTARAELDALLNHLTREQTNLVVRAFSYFSHLANIAEDQHHTRRARTHALAGAKPREGSVAHAVARARELGIGGDQLANFFARADIAPVLTAHPTEVQRKSILDREWTIARLLDARDRQPLTPDEFAENEEALRRAILILWQTRMLRTAKLAVMDEVNNALSFYDTTFLRALPRLHNAIEDHLGAAVPAFLRPGSWIGGDRDGNPFVTADILGSALNAQSRKAFAFYLEQTHLLGGELSSSELLVEISDELRALVQRSPDRNPHRDDEPYRRAIAGIYARLAATARELDHMEALRHPVAEAPPYADCAEYAAELDILDHSLKSHGAALLARGRLRRLRRAVELFGFHLAPLDLRQNSDVHARTVHELFETARPGTDYAERSEEGRIALLAIK